VRLIYGVFPGEQWHLLHLQVKVVKAKASGWSFTCYTIFICKGDAPLAGPNHCCGRVVGTDFCRGRCSKASGNTIVGV
jgi:hypothetical protein